jgi:hypothetical protein
MLISFPMDNAMPEELESLPWYIGASTARRSFWLQGRFLGEFRGKFLAFERSTKEFGLWGNFQGKCLAFKVHTTTALLKLNNRRV